MNLIKKNVKNFTKMDFDDVQRFKTLATQNKMEKQSKRYNYQIKTIS